MKKVLVVDDEKDILNIWIGMLKNMDSSIEVHTAENGELAMSLVNAVPKYDLIITDFKMPKMNGLELISELKKNPKTSNTTVLFFTGYMPELMQHSDKLDKVLIFEKPMVNENMRKYISLALKD